MHKLVPLAVLGQTLVASRMSEDLLVGVYTRSQRLRGQGRQSSGMTTHPGRTFTTNREERRNARLTLIGRRMRTGVLPASQVGKSH